MQDRYIRRYPPRRRNYAQWGCSCALLTGFVLLLSFVALYALGPALTGVAVQILSGAERLGETNSLFQNVAPAPTAVVYNPTSPQQVTINLGDYGSETVQLDPQHYEVVTGTTDRGAGLARVSFTEAGLLAICAQRSPICREGSSQYRNVALDLRPGGVVVYADLDALMGQRIGIVFRLDPTRTSLQVAGIDLNGGLYDYTTLPPEGLGAVDEIARTLNDMLRQLVLEASGERYRLNEIVIDETTLTLMLQ